MFKTTTKLLALILSLVSLTAAAAPKHVIIIRHAEKPENKNANDGGLSPEGRERAQKLVGYFENTLANNYGLPVAIYTFHNKPDGKRSRGIQTVTPLGASLAIPPDSTFEEGAERDLINSILKNNSYDGKTVLICWEHHLIHTLLENLGMDHAPKYPGDAFDRTYVVDLDENGEFLDFHDLAQHLMPNDSEN
jgi:hypothetical protein